MFTSVRHLGTAALATVPIVAMSLALAVPASADTQILTTATANPSTSNALVLTTTTVTADPSHSRKDDEVTYLATVQPVSGKAVPGGTVLFTVESMSTSKGTRLCTAYIPLNGIGNAKCKSVRAPVGTDTVTATYSGDAGFKSSVGTTKETVSERKAAAGTGSWNHTNNQSDLSGQGSLSG